MIGTTSSGISDQLRYIYSICRCYWDVATSKWKVHNGEIAVISFVINFIRNRLLVSNSRCRSRYKGVLFIFTCIFEINVNFLILYHFFQSESTTSPQFENFYLQNKKYNISKMIQL